MSITSERIKQRRKEMGMTMDELAKKMGVKSQRTIVNWENGSTSLSEKKIEKIASILEVSVAYLLGYIDTPKEELMTFDTGEEFEKARQKISNTPAQGDEITLIYGKGNELKNVKVKEISLQDSYKKIAANIAGSLSDINNEKWLEYGTLLLKSEKENS